MLRSIRVGPGQAHAPVRPVRRRGPHLLPVEFPTTFGPNGFGAKRSQVRPRTRLTEQLAPDELTPQCRGYEVVDLFGRSMLKNGRHRPPSDDKIRAHDAGGGEFLINEQLLSRRGLSAIRLGPVGCEESVTGHRNLTFLVRQRRDIGDRCDDLRSQLSDGLQIDMQFPANAGEGQRRNTAQGVRPATQELCDPVRAPQVQMRIVFPGDADTTQHLDAILGVALRGIDSSCRRDRRCDRQLRVG